MLTGLHRRCALLAWVCAFTIAPAAEPVEYGDPFLDSEAVIVPAAAEQQPAARSPVQTADIFGEPVNESPAGPEFLFPEGPPPTEAEAVYPDGAIPVQYPLDDRAYRGLPDAYPGNSDGWIPPTTSPLPPIQQPPAAAIGWKSVKASLTGFLEPALRWASPRSMFAGPSNSADCRVYLSRRSSAGTSSLDRPATDLPPQLYDLSLDLSMYRPVGDKWLFNLALTPSLFTDGENLSADAVRVLGRAMAYYTASPTLQWAGGIVYLDRADLPVLPAFGAICTPRDDVRFELMFPKPRLAWRQWFNGAEEQWVYVTGELGGQSWGVVRASGADDIATYRDLRLVLGLERKQNAGQSWFVEGGYVFGREVEYESNIGGADLSATGFLRVGGAF